MNYAAIRELLAHSPETRFAEVVIGNPNEIWSELRGLMAERDRAVELLRQVGNSRDELWESGHDELFENIEAIHHEREGSDRDHEGADEAGKIEENK